MNKPLVFILLLMGCSGLEKSEKEKIKKKNSTFQPILRNHQEKTELQLDTTLVFRDKYPWEKELVGRLHPITKEYFRCKGSSLNPPIQVALEDKATTIVRDCGGLDKHSLPIKEQKEFIYPALIEILNEIQKKLLSKVIITCGHRCPEHNRYADQAKLVETSKHQIGAEVDFYVEGYENRPQEVIQVIKQFYLDQPRYQNLKEFQLFSSLGKNRFENKEIKFFLNEKHERRDLDNRHPYPYITIELKYDFDQKKKIEYSWKEANGKLMIN
jgi:hypothetical protein